MKRLLFALIGALLVVGTTHAQFPPQFNLRLDVDTTNPTISITTPTSSATYDNGTSQAVTIAGDVSDNVSVTSVTFSHDQGQTNVACTFTTTFSCQVTLLQDGSPTQGDTVITVTASDAAGNTASDIITVTTDLSGAGASFGVIYNQNFDNCGIVNAWDGANWSSSGTQVQDAYWTDTKSYSLCGPGDNLTFYGGNLGVYFGGANGTPGVGVYASMIYEGTECPGNYGVTNRCLQYRPGEGNDAPQGGVLKYNVSASTTTTSIYISHVVSHNSSMLWKDPNGGAVYNDEPSFIKHVDINNDVTWGTSGGLRTLFGWGQGGQCGAPVGQNYAANCDETNPNTGSPTSTPWKDMVVETPYCYALYIDYATNLRRAWIGVFGGTMYQIQNSTALSLQRGNNRVLGFSMDTNQRDPEVNGNLSDSDATTSAGRAGKIWIDNLIVATAEDPDHNCVE